MNHQALKALIASLCFILGSCTTNVSPNTYAVGSVGQINRAVEATIVSARVVNLQGTQAIGTASGIAAGGVAGSMVGSGRGSALGAIGGALAGGIAGAMLEQNATAQHGVEYIVRTTSGNLMTLVQGIEPTLHEGQSVFVLYGPPARLILNTSQQ